MTRAPRYGLAVLLLSIVIVAGSCQFFTEPEPVVNATAHILPTDSLKCILSNYSAHQVVAGIITPLLVPKTSPLPIAMVVLYVDTTRVGSSVNPPYAISFDSRSWPGGEHQLRFYVYRQGDDLGLFRLYSVPSEAYTTSLVFYHNYPTAPKNVSITFEGPFARVSWDQNTDSLFSNYTISRWNQKGEPDSDIVIPHQSQTSFLDTTVRRVLGELAVYQVSATNGVASTNYNGWKMKMFGRSTPYHDIDQPINGLDGPIGIYRGIGSLSCYSFVTGEEITPNYFSIPRIPALPQGSPDGKQVWLWTGPSLGSAHIYCYVASTMQNVFTHSIVGFPASASDSLPQAFGIGPSNLVYCSFGKNRGLSVAKLGSPGNFLRLYPDPTDARLLSVSPDGRFLLSVGPNAICRFAITGDSLAIINQGTLAADTVLVDWPRSQLIVVRRSQGIQAFDLESLSSDLGAFAPPSGIIDIHTAALDSKHLFVSYRTQANQEFVGAFDLVTRQMVYAWQFVFPVHAIGLGRAGKYLIAGPRGGTFITGGFTGSYTKGPLALSMEQTCQLIDLQEVGL